MVGIRPPVLPPPQIQRIPQGLLGFFGIKNGGQPPNKLSSELVVTLPALEWYLLDDGEILSGSNALALGYTAFISVPDGEYWYVHHCCVTSAPGAGQTILCRPAVHNLIGAVPSIIRVGPQATQQVTGAQQTADLGWSGLLRPGMGLGHQCDVVVAGPVTVTFRALVSRFQM